MFVDTWLNFSGMVAGKCTELKKPNFPSVCAGREFVTLYIIRMLVFVATWLNFSDIVSQKDAHLKEANFPCLCAGKEQGLTSQFVNDTETGRSGVSWTAFRKH